MGSHCGGSFNGKSIDNRQQIDETHYQLPDARVQLIVQVDGRFRSGSDVKYFNSKPYVLTFESTQDASLKMPRYSKSLAQVKRAFSEGEPRWRLVDNQGNNIAYTTQRLPGKKGFLPYADLAEVIGSYNAEQGIIFEDDAAQDLEELVVSVDNKGEVSIGGDNLTQLKLWYTKSNSEERRAFQHWILDQE